MKIESIEHAKALSDQGKLIGCFEMDDSIYHHDECPGLSQSKISTALESLELMRYEELNGREDTTSTRIGKALHCMVLEPGKFNSKFTQEIKIEDFSERNLLKNLPDYKDWATAHGVKLKAKKKDDIVAELKTHPEWRNDLVWDNFKESYMQGKVVLNDAEMEKVEGMHKKLFSLPKAKEALCGHHEFAFFWICPVTEELCKCKPDNIHPSKGMLVDLKKTKDAKPERFMGSVYQFGYHIQNAFYIDGVAFSLLQAAEKPSIEFKVPDAFLFVAIEEKPPYAHVYAEIPEQYVDEGRTRYIEGIRLIQEARKTGIYPSYAPIVDGEEKILVLEPKSYQYK